MGYLQVDLSESARDLTAMITPLGLYRWKRLPFGLSSAPSCFQKIIAKIIEGIPGPKNLLDDIGICGRTLPEHNERLRHVLQRLEQYGATINEKKSVLGVTEMDFVGHHISAKGVSPLQSNVQDILAIAEPENLKQLQSFLGAANYYHKFIPH